MLNYKIELNDGVEMSFRIQIKDQLEMCKHFGNVTPVEAILKAIAEVGDFCWLLTKALSYRGNANAITNGEEALDILIDNGYVWGYDTSRLMFKIAAESGILTKKQLSAFLKQVDKLEGTADAQLNTEEDVESEEEEKNV